MNYSPWTTSIGRKTLRAMQRMARAQIGSNHPPRSLWPLSRRVAIPIELGFSFLVFLTRNRAGRVASPQDLHRSLARRIPWDGLHKDEKYDNEDQPERPPHEMHAPEPTAIEDMHACLLCLPILAAIDRVCTSLAIRSMTKHMSHPAFVRYRTDTRCDCTYLP